MNSYSVKLQGRKKMVRAGVGIFVGRNLKLVDGNIMLHISDTGYCNANANPKRNLNYVA